jgi:hypothetical protein
MQIVEWYFGFHAPSFRNLEGRIDPRLWFGHCEAWGYTEDETWLFLDPQGKGTKIIVTHRHDDVMDQLYARHSICESIVRFPAISRDFRFPGHLFGNCATSCGSLVGSYPRLAQAIAIDRPAALRSASWGLGQIMGFNHELAG